MSAPVLPGGPFRALFVPEVNGVPMALSGSETVQLLDAGFNVIADNGGTGGVALTGPSGSGEYVITSTIPAGAQPGDLYFYRISDTIAGQPVTQQICATVQRDLFIDIQNLVAILGAGCCN